MNYIEIIGQIFGIVGLIIIVSSFQSKGNKGFFVLQGAGSLMFVINFLLIGAVPGALYNLTNLIRGFLFAKNPDKRYKLITVLLLYTICFAVSLTFVLGDTLQIVLSSLVYAALMAMTAVMYKGNGKHIRYSQILYMSPSWLIYNIFNFTIGGILCESFNMISSIIALIRFRKSGFEK